MPAASPDSSCVAWTWSVSACPPQAALEVATLVAHAGLRGHVRRCQPGLARALGDIADVVGSAGATLVDAGIVGPPPSADRRTSLYLRSPDRQRPSPSVRRDRHDSLVLGPRVGAASAAKQAYALYNKGRLALALWPASWRRRTGSATCSPPRADRPGAELSPSSTNCGRGWPRWHGDGDRSSTRSPPRWPRPISTRPPRARSPPSSCRLQTPPAT